MEDNELTWAYLLKKFSRICHKLYFGNKKKIDTILTIFFAVGIILLIMSGMLETAVSFMGFIVFKLLNLSIQILLLVMLGFLALMLLAIAACVIILVAGMIIDILKTLASFAKKDSLR